MNENRVAHGSAEDRGSADAYYHRSKNPHKIVGHVRVTDLDAEELAAYHRGYNNESDRKDYGFDREDA